MIVDCENVAPKNILPVIKNFKGWRVHLLYGNNQTLSYDEAEIIKTCSFISIGNAYMSGPNAADFVIVATLANELHKRDYQSACIISNDKGYDPAILYLRNQNFCVNRYSLKEFVAQFDKTNIIQSEPVSKVAEKAVTPTTPEKAKKAKPAIPTKNEIKAMIKVSDNKILDENTKARILLIQYLCNHSNFSKKSFEKAFPSKCELYKKVKTELTANNVISTLCGTDMCVNFESLITYINKYKLNKAN